MHLSKKINLFIIILALLCSNANAINRSNHIYFSCNTLKGELLLRKVDGVLFYSFKKKNSKPFIINSKNNEYYPFLYNHYTRYQTEYTEISFKNYSYKYTIFDYVDGEQEYLGVTVKKENSPKENRIECISVQKNDLYSLTSILRCDKQNALGCQ